MIDAKDLIRTINSVISKNSDKYICGLSTGNNGKPFYNNGISSPKVCKMGLEGCKSFYNSIESEKLIEMKCPSGFTVAKKTFDTTTKYQTLALYSILSFEPLKDYESVFSNLPRGLKEQKDEVIRELSKLTIIESEQREYKNYLEELIETLLIGRIGLAIQSISHQFFTPLQGAMADVKNIENNIDTTNSIKRLTKNFEALSKLATEVQLLLSTSYEFNRNMLRKVVVHTMVNDIIESLISAANEKNIRIHQGFNPYSKAVDAIPGQLNIVLSNIISNAIKYSYKGFPEDPLQIEIFYTESEDFLIVNIKNEGCKITKEEINEGLIFDLGYRGIHSRDRQRKGSGNGLYISSEIIKSHGGKIKVSSTFTGGNIDASTDRYENIFSIYWPIIID